MPNEYFFIEDTMLFSLPGTPKTINNQTKASIECESMDFGGDSVSTNADKPTKAPIEFD